MFQKYCFGLTKTGRWEGPGRIDVAGYRLRLAHPIHHILPDKTAAVGPRLGRKRRLCMIECRHPSHVMSRAPYGFGKKANRFSFRAAVRRLGPCRSAGRVSW